MKNLLIITGLIIVCVFAFYIWGAIQVGKATHDIAFALQKSIEKRKNPTIAIDSSFMYSKD